MNYELLFDLKLPTLPSLFINVILFCETKLKDKQQHFLRAVFSKLHILEMKNNLSKIFENL